MIIWIEGAIGVAKSTLCSTLEKIYDVWVADEIANDKTIFLLDQFYQNKSNWAFLSQANFLLERTKANHIVGNYLVDRSIWGDFCFITVLKNEGMLTDLEYKILENMRDTVAETLPTPDLMVFLDSPIQTAYDRIIKRGRISEKDISIDYLTKINEAYLDALEDFNSCPVKYIDSSKHDLRDIEVVRSIFDTYLENIK